MASDNVILQVGCIVSLPIWTLTLHDTFPATLLQGIFGFCSTFHLAVKEVSFHIFTEKFSRELNITPSLYQPTKVTSALLRGQLEFQDVDIVAVAPSSYSPAPDKDTASEDEVQLEVVLDKNGKQVIEKAAALVIELPEMIVNTEIPVVNANPIKEEKPVVSEDISGKGSELSEKKVSGDETKEEDSEESTEDAEDIENSGDAEEAETENETETAAESEPNTEDAAEENVLEEAAEL